MSDETLRILVPALLGFAGAMVGALVAPWLNWSIEKRRNQYTYRQELIRQWRKDIEEESEDWDTFTGSATFSAILAHCPRKTVEELTTQRGKLTLSTAAGQDSRKERLLREVARIEREWKLY